jgi:hypothetical protein
VPGGRDSSRPREANRSPAPGGSGTERPLVVVVEEREVCVVTGGVDRQGGVDEAVFRASGRERHAHGLGQEPRDN